MMKKLLLSTLFIFFFCACSESKSDANKVAKVENEISTTETKVKEKTIKTPTKSTDDKSTDDKSTDDKSTDDKSADDKSADDKSADDKSADDKSADDKSLEDKKENSSLSLEKLIIAANVIRAKHEATDIRNTFKVGTDEKVYCYFTIPNKNGPTRKVEVVWKKDGKENHRYPLTIKKSPAFRTWAFLRISKSREGKWSCGIEDENQTLIGEKSFEITL